MPQKNEKLTGPPRKIPQLKRIHQKESEMKREVPQTVIQRINGIAIKKYQFVWIKSIPIHRKIQRKSQHPILKHFTKKKFQEKPKKFQRKFHFYEKLFLSISLFGSKQKSFYGNIIHS
jgi:hypothetical protein